MAGVARLVSLADVIQWVRFGWYAGAVAPDFGVAAIDCEQSSCAARAGRCPGHVAPWFASGCCRGGDPSPGCVCSALWV